MLGAGALERPRGMGWGGRWEGVSGWETHVNPWLIHVNVWQKPLQYCKVISLQLIKINEKKKKKKRLCMILIPLDHETFTPCFMFLECFIAYWLIVYGNLNRICILLLCENCINLNYVELAHSAKIFNLST